MTTSPNILFKNQSIVNDLETVRNKYALRVQKGIADKIVKNKNSLSIYLWLELKPLFSSGIIFSDKGLIPYLKISNFTGQCVSIVRKKISVLKKLGLLKIDENKNIVLASINKLPKVLKLKNCYSKKHKLKNNKNTQLIIKNLAIYENLKKQEHSLFKKIYGKELIEYFYYQKSLDNNYSNHYKVKNIKSCEDFYSNSFLRKFKKQIRKDFEKYKVKYKKIFDAQIQQISFGYPEINPNVTLSTTGIANLFGRKSASCGFYQSRKLSNNGFIELWATWTTIQDKSPAIYEDMLGIRKDVFSFIYPTLKNHTGRVRKYFLKPSNIVKPLENTIFF